MLAGAGHDRLSQVAVQSRLAQAVNQAIWHQRPGVGWAVMPAAFFSAGRGPPQTANQLDWVPGKEHKPFLQGEATAQAALSVSSLHYIK